MKGIKSFQRLHQPYLVKSAAGRLLKDFFHTSMDELLFYSSYVQQNTVSHMCFFHFFCFTAAFHCGGHTLVQKSDIDRARYHLDSLKKVNATGGQRGGWAERRAGSDVTMGPEGRGNRSEGAITDSSEQDTICFKRENNKIPNEKPGRAAAV